MKLSKVQKEIINEMRHGGQLSQFNSFPFSGGIKLENGMSHKVKKETVSTLEKANIIQRSSQTHLKYFYSLTEIGKAINI